MYPTLAAPAIFFTNREQKSMEIPIIAQNWGVGLGLGPQNGSKFGTRGEGFATIGYNGGLGPVHFYHGSDPAPKRYHGLRRGAV